MPQALDIESDSGTTARVVLGRSQVAGDRKRRAESPGRTHGRGRGATPGGGRGLPPRHPSSSHESRHETTRAPSSSVRGPSSAGPASFVVSRGRRTAAGSSWAGRLRISGCSCGQTAGGVSGPSPTSRTSSVTHVPPRRGLVLRAVNERRRLPLLEAAYQRPRRPVWSLPARGGAAAQAGLGRRLDAALLLSLRLVARPERTSYTSCVTGATTWPQRGSGRLRSRATRRGRTVRGRRRSASTSRSSPTGTARRSARSTSRSSLSACTTSRSDRRSSSATARRSRRRGCSAASCRTSTP